MKLLPRTQDHLDIIDVKDDILILAGGKFRLVVEANAINFDLLSEDEQNATIYAYANLVNSIDYPIQIVIRTRQIDVTSYIEYLNGQMHEQPSAALREQLHDYIDFVQQLVIDNTVLAKRFFVVIPYFSGGASASTSTSPAAKPKANSTQYSVASLEKAKTTLQQKFSDLQWQFNRLGIKIRQLNTEELVRLFYEVYNPEAGKNSGINQDIFGYTTSSVVSSIKEYRPENTQESESDSTDQTKKDNLMPNEPSPQTETLNQPEDLQEEINNA